MKKLLKSIFLLISTLSVFASAAQSTEIKHHINVGAGLGWTYGRFNFNTTEVQVPPPNLLKNFDLGKNSLASDLSLGYQLRWHNIMAGLEVDYLFMGMKRTGTPEGTADNIVSKTAKILSNGAFGAAAKIGYYLNETFLGYVGAGIESRTIKFDFTIQGDPDNSVNSKHSQTAFAGRIGFDYMVNQYVTLGAEYRKAFYNGTTKTNGTTTVRFKPETLDTVLLNVRFKFNLPNIRSVKS